MNENLSKSIKNVLVVFLICFLGVITYIAYFTVFKAPDIANKEGNKRLWAKRNEVLRGTIYDRNMQALTKSEKKDVYTQRREYTGGDMFTHALGYVDQRYGLTGLENKYDQELMNNNNFGFNLKEAIKTLDIKKLLSNKDKKEKVGNGLVTTLDYNVQKAAYDALGNEKGAIVVLNPKTGEILAMVSKPTYDPNKLGEIWTSLNKDENVPLLNRAVSGMYPPGSTFKVVTTASALENISGITTKIFSDNGRIQFNAKESLRNLNGVAWGNINLKDAFRHSSNVVFGTLAMDLGNDKLKATAEKFYFNKNTPSDGIVIDESKFPKLDKSEIGSIAQTGIGQSKILATPIQMALVASTIANDGTMMEPKIVKEVVNPEGKTIRKISPETITSSVSKENAKIIGEYMRSVILGGTGGPGAFDGTNAAGKTGTADYKDKNGKDAEPHSWFIGFAPYENPQVAIAVIVEGGGAGGGKAARAAGYVLKAALKK